MTDYWHTVGMVVLIVLCCLLVHTLAARAQEHNGHPPQDQALHDKFYSTWYVPNGDMPRTSSCCNKMDCEPAETRYRAGKIEFRGARNPAWREVPQGILEHNQSDPRESPDGRAHWCVYQGRILCAILGSGT